MMRLLLTSLILSILLADWIISQDVERLCPPVTCEDTRSRISASLYQYCYCDDQCADYGDCCYNAPNKTRSTNQTLYSCELFAQRSSFFVKRACPNGSSKYQSKCAMSANFSDHIPQMHLKIPVTSKLNKNITYGNIFCAFCDNNTNATLTFWHLSVTCGRKFSITITNISFDGPNSFLNNQPVLKKVLKFNNDTKLWQYIHGNETANCTMRPTVPKDLKRVARSCVAYVNATCPSKFLVTNITQKCSEYQSIVFNRNHNYDYRNAHCALCNGVPLQNLSCYQAPIATTRPTYRYVRTTKNPPAKEQSRRKPRTYLYVAMKSDCANLLSRLELTKVKAETVIYRTMNRTFMRNMTFLNGTGIQVCHVDNETLAEFKESKINSTFFRFVVNVGCLSACTFLLLHIWNFFASNEPKRINQKLLLSFAIAMLLGNVGFFYESVSNVALSDHLIVCAVDNFVTYYGFLAAFLWISSMAFDISCSVWSFAFDQTTVFNKNGTTLFMAYSLTSWILPALISSTLLLYNYTEGADTAYSCWLTNEVTLLWYFVLPLTVSMSVNLAFYLCTVFVVYTEDAVIEKMLKAGIEFKLHTCLVMTTNIMWLTIVLAGYLDNHSLVVLFTVCDVFITVVLFLSSFRKDGGIKSVAVLANNHMVTPPESIPHNES